MDVTLRPAVRKFIQDQVEAGRYGSPDEVLEEAVNRMMAETEFELDDETVAAISRAEEQLDRGEGIDLDEFAAEMRKRISR